MESCQRQPKSEAHGRSASKVPFFIQNIRWGSNYQTTPEWHTWDSNPHPLTPSSKSPKCQRQVETMTQCHHGHLFFYTATLSSKQLHQRDFLGGPGFLTNNPPSNAGDKDSIHGYGTKISHPTGQPSPSAATQAQHSQNKNK